MKFQVTKITKIWKKSVEFHRKFESSRFIFRMFQNFNQISLQNLNTHIYYSYFPNCSWKMYEILLTLGEIYLRGL